MNYLIDMKVYNSIPQEEISVMVPLSILSHGNIPIGFHRMELDTTEELLEQFVDKCNQNSDIKIIGVHFK